MTVEYAEQNEIDLDVFVEDWVGTEQLKLKQISRIEDEDEREAALDALATESVLREDQQKATQPVKREKYYAENRSRWLLWKYNLRHPLMFLAERWEKSIFWFIVAYGLYLLSCAIIAFSSVVNLAEKFHKKAITAIAIPKIDAKT